MDRRLPWDRLAAIDSDEVKWTVNVFVMVIELHRTESRETLRTVIRPPPGMFEEVLQVLISGMVKEGMDVIFVDRRE